MRKLFGSGKKKPSIDPQQEALAKLRSAETMLNKKIDFIESKIQAQIKIAIDNKTKNKRVALTALKSKKRYEDQLKNYEGMLNTVYIQIDNLENTQTTVEVAKSVQSATQAMKTAQTKLNVDKVSNIVDDMQEEHDKAMEITETLANMGGLATIYDDDALLEELNELDELEDKQLNDVLADAELNLGELPSVPQKLPNVPISTSTTSTKAKVALSGTDSAHKSVPNNTPDLTNKEIEDELNRLMDWS